MRATIRSVADASLAFPEFGADDKSRECCLEHERRVRRSRARLEDAMEYLLTNESASVGDVVRYLSMR